MISNRKDKERGGLIILSITVCYGQKGAVTVILSVTAFDAR